MTHNRVALEEATHLQTQIVMTQHLCAMNIGLTLLVTCEVFLLIQ